MPRKAYQKTETTYEIVSTAMNPNTPFLRSPDRRGGIARRRKRPMTMPLKKNTLLTSPRIKKVIGESSPTQSVEETMSIMPPRTNTMTGSTKTRLR